MTLKTWKYKINIYLEENKFRGRKKGPQYCIISFYPKHVPTFNELVIKNTPVKNFYFYGRSSPASWSNLIMRRQNLSSTEYLSH